MRARACYCEVLLSMCFGGMLFLSPIPINALNGEETGSLTWLASLKSSNLLVFSHCFNILSIFGENNQTYLKIMNVFGRKENIE